MSAQRVLLTIVLLPFVPLAYACVYALYACVYVASAAWCLAWDTAGAAINAARA